MSSWRVGGQVASCCGGNIKFIIIYNTLAYSRCDGKFNNINDKILIKNMMIYPNDIQEFEKIKKERENYLINWKKKIIKLNKKIYPYDLSKNLEKFTK